MRSDCVMPPPKPCETCGAMMERKRWDGGRMEELKAFQLRRFCNSRCAGPGLTKPNPAMKSYHYRARKQIGPECVECKTTETLQVHHLDQNPANNAPENLMTLCRRCHSIWHAQRKEKPAPCRVCGRKHKAKGLCDRHYQAMQRSLGMK